ncbi:MAG: hypothetical protein US58_C0041G0011, partial [Candidatus Magasanikbacteria bacterium GW2011_GWA2_37_8]
RSSSGSIPPNTAVQGGRVDVSQVLPVGTNERMGRLERLQKIYLAVDGQNMTGPDAYRVSGCGTEGSAYQYYMWAKNEGWVLMFGYWRVSGGTWSIGWTEKALRELAEISPPNTVGVGSVRAVLGPRKIRAGKVAVGFVPDSSSALSPVAATCPTPPPILKVEGGNGDGGKVAVDKMAADPGRSTTLEKVVERRKREFAKAVAAFMVAKYGDLAMLFEDPNGADLAETVVMIGAAMSQAVRKTPEVVVRKSHETI